jgi:hypothetical protein
MPFSWSSHFATRAKSMQASEIRELLKLLDKPDIISFAGGIPDPALFPVEAARAAYAAALGPDTASAALQYSVSEGYPPLRAWITEAMARLGAPCTPDNIVVTNGSQQALDFLGKLLLTPGDTALVTAPTYLGALQAFSAYEPRYEAFRPEDGNETAAEHLASARAAADRDPAVTGDVKFAYVVPDFANPTGITLSLAGRRRVLNLARDLDVPVIEDSAYAALRYDGADLPSLLALDIAETGHIDRSRVVYCGTFSKTLAPGLRVGWIAASRSLIRRLVLVKQAADLNASVINQMVMHRLAAGTFDTQVAKARDLYRRRRDAMLAALSDYMPSGVTWTNPDGGLFVWVTLPPHIDGKALLAKAVTEARVAFVPGQAFFADGSGANTIRLSFSLPDETKIRDGIRRLAALIP